jgi:hypothetical protein
MKVDFPTPVIPITAITISDGLLKFEPHFIQESANAELLYLLCIGM